MSMDLTFFDSSAVVNIRDSATRFSGAAFFESNVESYGLTVDGVWKAFVIN